MDASCVDHLLTEHERLAFETDGCFKVENALPPDVLDRLEEVSDRVGEEERNVRGMTPYDRLSVMDFIGRDEAFLELVDWPTTFPKVFGLMGWNIQIYHSHLVYSPPEEVGDVSEVKRGWHQDSGRLNAEMEFHPRPMISLKLVYFLSDCMEDNMANFYVVPGSQLDDSLIKRGDRQVDPENGIPIYAKRGDAVFFDRRLWHTASPNGSTVTREGLFYGYSFRWIRPRDNMTVAHYMDQCDPIRRQLLGAGPSGGKGYSSPMPEDVPLRDWMEENLETETIARWEH